MIIYSSFDAMCLFKKIILWLCWVFVAAHGLSLVVVSGGCSLLWCTGFSLQWLLLCGAWALACGLQ